MRADLLHVVTAISNPVRWESRLRLYKEFEQHMLDSGVHLTTVECAYGDRPFVLAGNSRINHVRVRARSLVWTKENLLNIGISRLPQEWKYVAWIDADIAFRRKDWAAETVQALQQYDIVQPWTDCYDLGPHDEHMQVHRSFCKQWTDFEPVGPGPYRFAHPGYAWAATRQTLDHLGGLVETAALGAADHHMALALVGKMEESLPIGISPEYIKPIAEWQARARTLVAGNIGCVPGTIEHRWHGAKAHRRYIDRWQILIRNRFDPSSDLKRNVWGVLELSGNKPTLRREIDAYMRARNEDSNMLEA